MDTIIFVKDRNWPGTNSSQATCSPTRGCANGISHCTNARTTTKLTGTRSSTTSGQTADDMGLEGLADWFVELNDPTTINARYWVLDGIEYLDAAHTMPRDEM